MTKPRLLIPLTMQFSVRYLLRTGLLARIKEYAQPVIALGWDDQALTKEFEASGAEVYRLPGLQRGFGYERVRSALKVWHQMRMASPSTAIDERRSEAEMLWSERWRGRIRRKIHQRQLQNPATVTALLARERELLQTDTNAWEYALFCSKLHIDAAFSLTPYLPDEEMLLRVCGEQKMPLCAAILSFDNLTTRGWIPIKFDHYLLWNQYNKNELLRGYPDVAAENITIVGPAQFDFYWNPNYLWDESAWRSRLNLPDSQPVILYGAGHYGIVPHEPHFVAQLDAAIAAGEIPERPVILFRRHPNDPVERWKGLLRTAKHVIYDDPWPANGPILGRTNVRDENIARLTSSLCHSAVHISVSSTMTIDGSIFDRPQIGPAYDDRPGSKYDRICHELYLREHYLPITNSGGLALTKSRPAMVEAVRNALLEPTQGAEGRARLVKEICTFADGQCTSRVAGALGEFLNKKNFESPPLRKSRAHKIKEILPQVTAHA